MMNASKIGKRRNPRFGMLLAGLVLLAACKKSTVPSIGQSPAASPQLPMPPAPSSSNPRPASKDHEFERVLDVHYGTDTVKKNDMRNFKNALDAQIDAEIKLAEINRRTMVVPASPDFKPEPVGRKVRLKLILEKAKIHPGDFLRFRLEMTNVGRQAVDFVEFQSGLFKTGGLSDTDRISFHVTDPRGSRSKLDGVAASYKVRGWHEKHPESKFEFLPDSMPKEAKEKWFEQTQAMSAASTVFTVKLLPGETLRSRGDGESTGETFRTLWCEQDFDRKGRYKLQVVLDDRPTPLTKTYVDAMLRSGSTMKEIQDLQDKQTKEALGPASSNAVTFEVAQ